METILAWHFLSGFGLLRNGNKPPVDGEWSIYAGPIDSCEPVTAHPFDALYYVHGPILCRVECRGKIVYHSKINDRDEPPAKLICRARRIIWRRDITPELRAFARQCAFDVLHLWDAPQVVKDYLATGDEVLRAAARAAAIRQATDADFLWSAIQDGARVAAWAAATDSYRSAAKEAAYAAAWAVSGNISLTAAGRAAWDAVKNVQRQRFEALCEGLISEQPALA